MASLIWLAEQADNVSSVHPDQPGPSQQVIDHTAARGKIRIRCNGIPPDRGVKRFVTWTPILGDRSCGEQVIRAQPHKGDQTAQKEQTSDKPVTPLLGEIHESVRAV